MPFQRLRRCVFTCGKNWIATILLRGLPRLPSLARNDISVSGKPLTANCRLAMTLVFVSGCLKYILSYKKRQTSKACRFHQRNLKSPKQIHFNFVIGFKFIDGIHCHIAAYFAVCFDNFNQSVCNAFAHCIGFAAHIN